MEVIDIQDFLNYYEKIRKRTENVISCIPAEQFDWQYSKDRFSIADIIRHIGAIERYLYAEVIDGRVSIYSGCGKKIADGKENVLEFFRKSHMDTMQIIAKLQNDDLAKKCRMPGNATLSIASALRALVEHEIHHRAQLYTYLGMLNIQTPPIFGLTSEQVIEFSKENISES